MDLTDKTCNDCACISCTEEQQHEYMRQNIIFDHRCTKFYKRIFHYDTHKDTNYIIYPCNECNFDYYLERE